MYEWKTCRLYTSIVDWGDGTKEEYDLFINPLSTPAPTHTYAKKGVYYVSISGTAEKIYPALNSLQDTLENWVMALNPTLTDFVESAGNSLSSSLSRWYSRQFSLVL